MKIRTGFVSNSSSSSYLILMDKEDYQKMAKEFTEAQRAVIEMLYTEKVKAFGKNMVTISWMAGNSDTFEDADFSAVSKALKKEQDNRDTEDQDDEFNEDDYANDETTEFAYEFRDSLSELAEKFGAFTHSTDC